MKTYLRIVAASALLFATCAVAQEWPTKPIRFLNPNAAGAGVMWSNP